MMNDPALAVGCFFHCEHVERGEDYRAVHAAMEAHYRAKHTADINRAVAAELRSIKAYKR